MASAQLRPPYIQNNLISVCLISEMHCIGKVLLYETTKPDKEMTRIHLFLWPRMSTMPYNIFHLDTFPFYENRTGTGSYTDNTVEIGYMVLGYMVKSVIWSIVQWSQLRPCIVSMLEYKVCPSLWSVFTEQNCRPQIRILLQYYAAPPI